MSQDDIAVATAETAQAIGVACIVQHAAADEIHLQRHARVGGQLNSGVVSPADASTPGNW